MSQEIEPLKQIRKLAQPRALTSRWARTQRFYINPKFRVCFDIESDPAHFKKSITEKVKLANTLKEANGAPVSEYDYRRFLIWMSRHPNVMRARTIMFLSRFQDEKLIEHVFIMERKALESEDPNKLINLHKFISHFNVSTMELLGLNIPREPKPPRIKEEPDPGKTGMVYLQD